MLYHVLCVVSLFLTSEAYRKIQTNPTNVGSSGPNISWYINNTGMQMSPQTYNFPIAPTNGGGGALVAVLAPALMGGFLSASPSGSIPTKIAEVGYS